MAILSIKNIKEDKNELVGKRAVMLSSIAQNLTVPMGFVITKEVFNLFMEETGIKNKISNLMKITAHDDSDKVQNIANEIQKLIVKAQMPEEIRDAIIEAYQSLNIDEETPLNEMISADKEPMVDVKTSSITGEADDIMITHVTGMDKVIEAVLSCYALHYAAKSFQKRLKENIEDKGIGVIIQRSLNPEISGSAYVQDGESGKFIVIKAVFGLKTEATQNFADVYLVNYEDTQLMDINSQKQPFDIKKNITTREVAKQSLSDEESNKVKLTDEQINDYSRQLKKALSLIDEDKAVEFCVENSKFYITSIQKKKGEIDYRTDIRAESDEDGDEFNNECIENELDVMDIVEQEPIVDSDQKGFEDQLVDEIDESNDVQEVVCFPPAEEDEEDRNIFSAFKSQQENDSIDIDETNINQAPSDFESPSELTPAQDDEDDNALLTAKHSLGQAVVECDLAILKKLKQAYMAMFNDDSELEFDDLVEIVGKETNIPEQDKLSRIREIRGKFIDEGIPPSVMEVKFVFDETKKFFSEFNY